MVPKATGSEKCEKMSFCTTLKPYFFMGTGLYHWKSFKIQTTVLEILKKLNLMKKYVGPGPNTSLKSDKKQKSATFASLSWSAPQFLGKTFFCFWYCSMYTNS